MRVDADSGMVCAAYSIAESLSVMLLAWMLALIFSAYSVTCPLAFVLRRHRKRREVPLAIAGARRDQRHQVSQRYVAANLTNKRMFVRALGAHVQAKISLLNMSDREFNLSHWQVHIHGAMLALLESKAIIQQASIFNNTRSPMNSKK